MAPFISKQTVKTSLITTWLVLLSTASFAQPDFWVRGSGPEGGQVETLYRHGNGDLFLSMRWSQRIYRSTDNGMSWTSIETEIPDAVNSFSGDAEGNIYAAVACWQGCGSMNGVWKSSDGGDTWAHLGLANTEVRSVFVAEDGTLLAGTNSNVGGRLYRSTNGGANWSAVLSTEDAVGGFAAGADGDLFAAAEVSGFFRSTNGGMNWTVVTGLPCNATCSSNWPNKAVISHLLNDSSGQTVYAFSPFQGVLSSTDRGATWTPIQDGLPADPVAFEWDMNAAGDIVVSLTEGRVFRLEHGGSTWTDIGDPGFQAEYFLESITYGNEGSILVAPGTRGPYRTDDGGATWSASKSGLVDASVGLQLVGSDGTIYVPSGAGVQVSSDLGATWEELAFPADLAGNFAGGGLLGLGRAGEFFAGSSRLARSADEGSTWDPIETPWQETDNVSNQRVYAPAAGQLFVSVFDNFVGDGNLSGLYRSTDDGSTWNRLAVGSGDLEIRFLEFASDGALYAGTSKWPESAVYRSSDNGNTWGKIWSVQERDVTALAVTDDGTLLVTSELGVQRSDNGGTTWTSKNAGLPNTSWAGVPMSRAILATPEEEVYLGVYGHGVWVSQDKGDSWTTVSTGLGDLGLTYIESLALARGYLLAGSSSSGLYRSTSRVIVVGNEDHGRGDLPDRFVLDQNYPNPFNPRTTIRFELSAPSEVSLTVTDLTGRVLWTALLGPRQAGPHEVAFDAAGLGSGVYLYRLQAGSYSQTRQMVLLK